MNRTTLLLIACLPLTCAWSYAWSAGNSAREALYRCKDANGQTHFGDSMPPECLGRDTEVLSDRGSLIRMIDGTDALAAKAARKEQEQADKKAKEDAAMRDRMLVEAYLSVQEIEALRDQRLDLIDSQVRLDEQNLEAFNEREKRLLNQVQRYLPYSDKPNAQPIPDHVAEDMVNLATSRKVTEERIATKQDERAELQAKFASDIKRFKELKGVK